VDKALAPSGGDALVNVTVSNSLYTFIPIYNLFSYACTEVRGIAVKLQSTAPQLSPATPPAAAPTAQPRS
jgi:hypothetical protein